MGCAEHRDQGLPGLFPLGSQVFQVSRVCHTSLSTRWSGEWREDTHPDPDTVGFPSLERWGLP